MWNAVPLAFTPSQGPARIGVEMELHVLAGAPQGPPPPGHALSFEPGGQLELSIAPQPSVARLVRQIERGHRWATSGAEIALTGTHPLHGLADVPLRRRTPRYVAMQRLFDRTGPDGRRMMRLTASLQVCVDRLPGVSGRDQWLVANLAGPALAAAFANSPRLDGRASLLPGNRTRIWQGLPQDRVGYDGRQLDARDPVGAYAAFARAAERLPIPETRDDHYHLGTLFPPVRPRPGYLELRFLDAQPLSAVGPALAAVWRLMYDDRVRREALELLLPGLPSLWHQWGEATAGRSAYLDDLLTILGPGRQEMPA